MNSLVIFLVVFGVFLPSTLGAQDACPGNGDGAVDCTKENSTWYYCQTSQPNRDSNNCYVKFTKGANEGEANAETHSFALAEGNAEGVDNYLMKLLGPGKYEYVGRGTTGKNIKVSADGKCLAYWKCHGDEGKWNGIEGTGAYFMFICTNPAECKKNGKYDNDKQNIIKQAQNSMKFEIFDLDQAKCAELNIKPQ